MSASFTVALPAGALLGEGPVWESRTNRLWWVDIAEKAVNRFDPASGRNEVWRLESRVGAVAPTLHGDAIVAIQEGIARFDPVSGRLSGLHTPPQHDPATTRFNDGKCDPRGRFVVGTMSLTNALRTGALYSFSADGQVQVLLRDVSLSNGLGWSPDGTRMFYVDTPTRQIAVFDYDLDSGTLHDRRVAVDVPESFGYPDGLTVDADGMIWLALWGGGAVTRWDPHTGRLLERHALPASQITSCAFGGPLLDTLFITSARDGLSEEQLAREPLAGAIFSLRVSARGQPSTLFGG